MLHAIVDNAAAIGGIGGVALLVVGGVVAMVTRNPS
jgi:hypothetical protein